MTPESVLSLFDYLDGNLYWRYRQSNRVRAGSKAGSTNKVDGYARVGVAGKVYLVHRIIYLMHTGTLPQFVDHIDGDRANNRFENLRPATKSQNQCNKGAASTNTSGVKGVSFHKKSGKWRAQLRINNRAMSFGLYEDIELAELVVSEMRCRYHGEYARQR